MADAVETAKSGISTVFNTVRRAAVPVLTGMSISLLFALSSGGISALGGATFGTLAQGVGEGVGEAATGLADGAESFSGWVKDLSA
ncbi:MAG: hypothetical protein AAF182_02300 [Pseudomonadota bacterium]